MKRILGLDLGTNSIGWALIQQDFEQKEGKIIDMGSRIIPMSQDILNEFASGNSISQTKERTRLRGVRRLKERHLLRRERLHRVLHVLGFLPEHYEKQIDFQKHPGKFIPGAESKINFNPEKEQQFVFQNSYNEMLEDFKINQPVLVRDNKKIPYDWTIYYLRKKALTRKISKEELAWVLLHFNQKRGYYQLRGEDDEDADRQRSEEFYALKVVDVQKDNESNSKSGEWYNIRLENGWTYRRTFNIAPDYLIGKALDLIVTTSLNEDGSVKRDKEGKEKRSFRAPKEDDWNLIKKKTEAEINRSEKTVGSYIYDTLLRKPDQKVRGNLIRTIERKFYKEELRLILFKQLKYHQELSDSKLFERCVDELYKNNENHKKSLLDRDFVHLFLNDIIFYQRPLKSKKSAISNCPLEERTYLDKATGELKKQPIKCIAKSHPFYQEFRLWQYVHNLRIFARERTIDFQLQTDIDVTEEVFSNGKDRVALFDLLNEKKEFESRDVLKFLNLKASNGGYFTNLPDEKKYPGNETRFSITSRLKKVEGVTPDFLTKDIEVELWHILYSVEDNKEVKSALLKFANRHSLPSGFVAQFQNFPLFKKEYGAYSEKAIKKLLPLLRMGKYWSWELIDGKTKERIYKIIEREFDETIDERVYEKGINLLEPQQFQGLPLWLAGYIVYNRHSEASEVVKWNTSYELGSYINGFKQHALRNPIVEQVVIESLRVVKDIWEHFGDGKEGFFDEIHVELGRDMKNPADRRGAITKRMIENENTNLRIKRLLVELFNDGETANVRPYSPMQQEILKIYEEAALSGSGELPEDIQKISKMAQPSQSQLTRYKLWLEQKYRSPYTGSVIPLSKLFTVDYEIEHVIPQARYFDDSLSNKVICEAEVNREKSHQLAYEFIKNNEGKRIELNYGKVVTLFTIQEYEKFVKEHYGSSQLRSKKSKLLMNEIPDKFINRQLTDSRYISKLVRNLLSNIVREENENEPISKNIVTCSGKVTAALKQDWGLNNVWNTIITPRFERLNTITNSQDFGYWTNKDGKNVFQVQIPLEYQKGFSKKRIDHRHHALDALIVASATRSHVNYLSNESAKSSAKTSRYDLKNKLCFKDKKDASGNYSWSFYKPWDSFTKEAKDMLQSVIVSHKQNNRVINKTVNFYQKWVETPKGKRKELVKQTKGDNWAIRKSLHKDTVLGQVTLRSKKTVSLSKAIDAWEEIVHQPLKKHLKQMVAQGMTGKEIKKYFKDRKYIWETEDISKVEIYVYDENMAARRVPLDTSFDKKRIEGITDSGIRKILFAHLSNNKYHDQLDEKGNSIPSHKLAFTPEGLDEMNKNIIELNGGKFHHPVYKVRLAEPVGGKFPVGYQGNKSRKLVEADKGTNLFFGVYADGAGKRSYDTIPLNVVIERQKQGLAAVPEHDGKGNTLLFSLSPGDLVYVPDAEENELPVNSLKMKPERIYKLVSVSGSSAFFAVNFFASPVALPTEFGPRNKAERSIDGQMIKQVCIKLAVDRLGNVTFL